MSLTQVPIWLITELRAWIGQRRTGSLEIHFYEGGIANVNRKEILKFKDAHKSTPQN